MQAVAPDNANQKTTRLLVRTLPEFGRWQQVQRVLAIKLATHFHLGSYPGMQSQVTYQQRKPALGMVALPGVNCSGATINTMKTIKQSTQKQVAGMPEGDSTQSYQVQLGKPLENDPDYPGQDYTSLMVNVIDGAVQAEVCVDEDPLEKTEPLTADEQQALQRCETVIQRHKQSFYELALALEEIKRRKLYRDRFNTFPEYCLEVHGLGKSYAYNHAAAGKVIRENSTTVEKAPENEHQARKLVAKAAKPRKTTAKQDVAVETPVETPPAAAECEVVALEAKPPTIPMPVSEGGTTWAELHELAQNAYNIFNDSSRREELEKVLYRLKTELAHYAELESRSTGRQEAA